MSDQEQLIAELQDRVAHQAWQIEWLLGMLRDGQKTMDKLLEEESDRRQ